MNRPRVRYRRADGTRESKSNSKGIDKLLAPNTRRKSHWRELQKVIHPKSIGVSHRQLDSIWLIQRGFYFIQNVKTSMEEQSRLRNQVTPKRVAKPSDLAPNAQSKPFPNYQNAACGSLFTSSIQKQDALQNPQPTG